MIQIAYFGDDALDTAASRQVVGDSGADCTGLAFLWEPGGPIVDLNTLVTPPSALNVVEGIEINDRGEIAAAGHDEAGNDHSLLLIPCDENHPGIEGNWESSCFRELEHAQSAESGTLSFLVR